MTTQNPASFAQPVLGYAPPSSAAAQRKTRLGDRYFSWLCFVLLGYALGGRGFAYWGVNPLFIGEITLMIGVYVLFKLGIIPRLLGVRPFIPLMMFMFWGLCCTVPYFDKYGKDTIRDAVIWGYGTYAFIVAGLLISDPMRVRKLIYNYRKFVVWFLLLAPISTIISNFFDGVLPPFPGAPVSLIQVKGGDICVHLAGCFAYIVALGSHMSPWLAPLLVPLNLGLNLQGRAGMVAFFVAVFVSMVLRPLHPRAMRIFFVMGLGLFLMWAVDLKIDKGDRELSFDFLVKAVSSIVKDSDDDKMQGSKEWRQRWWNDIINYTVHGPYFWTGKGFGVNLANDDGYQVENDDALRSPHSGHMTMLARMGVPGFCVWVLTQGTLGLLIVKSYIVARRKKLMNWSGVFLFLGAYWAAFMANTGFDVFIEGPMGGIWLWCVYGTGIGCMEVYKRYPELLNPPPAPQPIYISVIR
ncbi:MAG TPA: O-antigen ligase family protein [Tepidisphaeraceae bacterium]|nr:O-antigen ligase family protein [Tepidisphaeraceae bacterium]